ncbi:hypothetical protein RFI_13653 [Reticulomyxa filosa]|uniref:UDENN domain-containing protein n=1 Tax=Reticulomyxa filosa TaxID=46433 RepID=X6NC99_RETFI|nr:hypothetical protein RFI_13653 [Reticulomyxa filosa]|eukprot:ETO23528.1 hypothetical protein RFI_13653 [Reticulomyxa filosa]
MRARTTIPLLCVFALNQFCQPEGAEILIDNCPLPTFLSFLFVLSFDNNATFAESKGGMCCLTGEKMFAVTVTFYEEMEEAMVEMAKKSVNNMFSGSWKPSWPDKAKKFYYSKSVCILSYYPFFRRFRECLKEIYRVACSPGNTPIERFIVHLCKEIPLPLPAIRAVVAQYAHTPIVFKRPGPTEFPLLDVDLERIFGCLSLDNVILVFRALLTQAYKIVLTSNYVSVITEISEGLISFLVLSFFFFFTIPPKVIPFFFFFVYIFLANPKKKKNSTQRETIIVDLDNNKIHIPDSIYLIELPNILEKQLKTQLIQEAHVNVVERYTSLTLQTLDAAFVAQDTLVNNIWEKKTDNQMEKAVRFDAFACRVAFWNFFVTAMGSDYLKHLIYPDDSSPIHEITDMIRLDDFLKYRPKPFRSFWEAFSKTQAFERFVENLTFGSSSPDSRKYQLQWFYQFRSFQFIYHHHILALYAQLADTYTPLWCVFPLFLFFIFKEKTLLLCDVPPCVKCRCCAHISSDVQDSLNSTKKKRSHLNNGFQDWCWKQQITKLPKYIVPAVNTADIPDDYSFEPSGVFPMFVPSLFSEPRHDEENEKEDQKQMKAAEIADERKGKKKKIKELKCKTPSSSNNNPYGGRGLVSNAKSKSIDEKTKYDLLQIYGCWFATRVASLDYASDIELTSKAAEKTARAILDVLYRMSDSKISHDVPLKPDELIYKSGLILCGKLKRPNEAKKIFKELKKQGIQPSQSTYGAYTNAMASSGTSSMLQSGLSSGSGRGSLEAHTGRNSLDLHPATVADISAKHQKQSSRSRSAIVAKTIKHQETSPKLFNTINESQEIDPSKRMTTVDICLSFFLCVRFIPELSTKLNTSSIASHDEDGTEVKMIESGNDYVSKATERLNRASSKEHQALEEKEEEKVQSTSSMKKQTRSAENGSRDETKNISEPKKEQTQQTAILIDYSTIQMDTRQQCKCGYMLSDAEVLANWPEEFLSMTINCSACNLNSFVPKIRVRCIATEMSLQKQIYQQITLDFKVTYLSPSYLRRSMETIVSKNRQRLEDGENLRKHHPDQYWNLLWYFFQRKLDLNWLLEDLDSKNLQIVPIIDTDSTKFPTDNEVCFAVLSQNNQMLCTFSMNVCVFSMAVGKKRISISKCRSSSDISKQKFKIGNDAVAKE